MSIDLTITDLHILRAGWVDILSELSAEQECACPNCGDPPIEEVLERIAELQALIRQHDAQEEELADHQPTGRAN